LLGAATIACGAAVALSIAPVLALRWIDPPTSAFMLANCWDGSVGGLFDCRLLYEWVDRGDISPHAALAVIASEDQKFLHHDGFDFAAIADAALEGARGGPLRGASTISQQVAKNLFLWPGRSLARKGLEIWFTVAIEAIWSKRRILEIYLNVCEFGYGVYGVGAASRFFLGKRPADLSVQEAALMAAVLPDPLRLRIDRPSPATLAKRDWIAAQMLLLGPAHLAWP
jgi:monofunctional biosynthetic peptidoglycan transglycosylase